MLKLDPDALSTVGCNIASGIVIGKFIDDNIKGKYLYMNCSTLYRNYIGCLDGKADDKIKELKDSISLRKLIANFIDDTKLLINGLLEAGIEPIIYISDYKAVMKSYPSVRQVSSIKGLNYFIRSTEKDMFKPIMDTFKGIVININHKVPYKKNMFIMTHIGLDLLSFNPNNKVTLIESHTSELKERGSWNSKYFTIGKLNMSTLPFAEVIYMLLGDNVLVKPQSMAVRKLVYDILIKAHLPYSATNNDILSVISTRDRVIANELKTLLRAGVY